MNRTIRKNFTSIKATGYLSYNPVLKEIYFEYVSNNIDFWGTYSLRNEFCQVWRAQHINRAYKRTLANRDKSGVGKGKSKADIRKMLSKAIFAKK